MKSSEDVKSKVAREAATLLYFGAEKEYKQAKLKAAETFGTHFLPTNLEIALELDRIAEEKEGSSRKEHLIIMRKQALKIMKLLNAYCPLLIGSVWRGTIRYGSDIDIAVYAENTEEIIEILKTNKIKISKTSWTTVNKQGKTLSSFNIKAQDADMYTMEIVVRTPEEAKIKRKCEIFGDQIKGLKPCDLEKILTQNPTQKFLPNK